MCAQLGGVVNLVVCVCFHIMDYFCTNVASNKSEQITIGFGTELPAVFSGWVQLVIRTHTHVHT